jgi:hypothetical protein
MNHTLSKILVLPVMAIVASLALAVFMYVRFELIGIREKSADEVIVIFEMTGIMFSSAALSGQFFHRWFGNEDESESIKKFMGWRIKMCHLLTLGFIVMDVFV